MGCQCGDTHGDQGSLGGRHRPNGREELVGAGTIDNPQQGRAARCQLERSLAAILGLDASLDQAPPDETVDELVRADITVAR